MHFISISVYVEAFKGEENCNRISFNFADEFADRQWKLLIRQYNCDYPNRAPEGRTLLS